MAEITSLPSDAVLTGSEVLPILDNNVGKKTTIESVKDYVQTQIATTINVSSSAASFSRQYPVVGSIKKGQACGIFRDTDGTLKMKASDNTNSLIASMSDTESFDTNIDGLELDRALSSGDLTIKPKDRQLAESTSNPYVNGSGIEFALTESSENTDLLEWNGLIILSDFSSGGNSNLKRNFQVTKVSYSKSSRQFRVTLRPLEFKGNCSPYYLYASGVSGSTYTRFSTTCFTTETTDNVRSGTFNQTHGDSVESNLKIYIAFSYSSSSPDSNQFRYAETESEASQSYNLDTDLIENNFMKLAFTQRGSSNIYDFTPSSSVYLQKFFGNLIPSFSFSSISLNTDTGVLSITSSSATRFSIWIKAGDTDIVKDANNSTTARSLSSYTVTLNPSQITAFTNNNNSLEFKFTDNVNLSNKFENIANLYFPFEQSSSDVTTSFTDIESVLVKDIFKLSSTKALLRANCSSFSSDKPQFDSSGNYNGHSKEVDTGVTNKEVLLLIEYENSAWSVKKSFNPVALSRNKSSGAEQVTNSFNKIFKAYEDDDEIHFGFISRDSIVSIAKYNKDDDSFEYFVNETSDSSGTRFNFQSYGEYGSLNWNPLVFRQLSATGEAHNYLFVRNGGRSSSSVTSGHNDYAVFCLLQGTVSDAENSSHKKITFAELEVDDLQNYIRDNADTEVISEINSDRKALTFCFIGNGLNSSDPRLIYITLFFNSDFSAFEKNYNSSTRRFDGVGVYFINEYYAFYNNALINNTFQSLGAPTPLFNVLTLRTKVGYNFESDFFLNYPVYNSSTGTLTAGKDYSSGYAANSINQGVIPQERRAGRGSILTFSDEDNRPQTFYRRYGMVNEPQLLFFYNTDKFFFKIGDPVAEGLAIEFDTRVATAIGLAQDNYSEGDTGTLSYLKGSSVITLSGLSLVVGADYYFNNVTGELNSSGGRRVGRAISETELLVA